MDAGLTAKVPVLATIGMGANLGDAARTLQQTIRRIASLPGTTLHAISGFYGSQPVAASGPDFVNAVIQVNTMYSAETLLQQLQSLEQQAGRERPYQNAPRTLDLDLLLYGNASIQTTKLTVPHPRMHERAFVLVPLAEIAPEWTDAAHLVAVQPGQGVWRLEQDNKV